jgi:hypothetical protein
VQPGEGPGAGAAGPVCKLHQAPGRKRGAPCFKDEGHAGPQVNAPRPASCCTSFVACSAMCLHAHCGKYKTHHLTGRLLNCRDAQKKADKFASKSRDKQQQADEARHALHKSELGDALPSLFPHHFALMGNSLVVIVLPDQFCTQLC